MSRHKFALVAALFFLIIAFVPGVPPFWVTLMNSAGLAALVAIGLVILTGVGGMTSFGQAAFIGFSAYTTAVLTTDYGFSPWMTLPLSLAVTGLAALLIGLVTVRLSGHFLPLGTIAWAVAIVYLFGNLRTLGGFNGISGIPPLSFGEVSLLEPKQVWPVTWAFVVLAVVMTQNLLNSRVGRAMRSLRYGTTAAEAYGIRVARMKLIIFIYAAVLGGVSGWLFAHIQRGVTPSAFGLNSGIEYLLMVVIGGAGHLYGALLGAAVVVLLKDQLQDILPMIFGEGGNYEAIAFGAILVLILHYAQAGLWPMIARWSASKSQKADSTHKGSGSLPELANHTAEGPLTAHGLVKKFGGLVAVNDVSLSVNRGEIVALLGPNGAGKSTTFNLLTGVLEKTAGDVTLGNVPIGNCTAAQIAELGIARTFQHVKLIPDMTVLENVAIGGHLRGRAGFSKALLALDRAEEDCYFSEANAALARVGIADQGQLLASELSLGSARVVEIARALCLSPQFLLLDEPAAGLRKREKSDLAKLLSDLRGQGIGILLVEHDMEFVMGLADNIVVLDFGTQIAQGTPEDIRSNAKVQEAYLGGAA